MIRRERGFGGSGWVAEMVGQLAAQRPLNQRLLEPPRRGLDFFGGQRSVTDDLIKDFSRDRRQHLGRLLRFRFAGHTVSSCYAPHTKIPTPSLVWPLLHDPNYASSSTRGPYPSGRSMSEIAPTRIRNRTTGIGH